MPYRHTPPEQTYPGHAARKRNAAARREEEARQLRREADELDRIYREFEAARRAGKPTKAKAATK